MALKFRHAALAGLGLGAAIGAFDRHGRTENAAMPSGSTATMSEAPSQNPAMLYKWRDDQGVWNYTDQPPADHPFERIVDTPNVSSVPTVVPDSGLVEASAPPAQ